MAHQLQSTSWSHSQPQLALQRTEGLTARPAGHMAGHSPGNLHVDPRWKVVSALGADVHVWPVDGELVPRWCSSARLVVADYDFAPFCSERSELVELLEQNQSRQQRPNRLRRSSRCFPQIRGLLCL